MKTLFKITVFIVSIALICGCSSTGNKSSNPKYGGTLRINSSDVPDIIYPGQVLKQSEQVLINQIFDGLVKYDAQNLEIEPALSKAWRIERNQTLYTFYLETNAFFHTDNCFKNKKTRRIVAQDVKYSIEQIARFHVHSKHEISEQFKRIIGSEAILGKSFQTDSVHISGIEVVNDTTIIFQLSEPDPLFIHFLASTNTKVFPREGFLAYGFKSTTGSGAYTFKYPEIKGHAITLVANPNYYRKNKLNQSLPFIDTIQISFITSPPKELALFEQGLLDLVLGVGSNYVSEFLDKHIEQFQADPPHFIMKQVTDAENIVQYNFMRSNIQDLYINSIGYFDLATVYFKEPAAQVINMK